MMCPWAQVVAGVLGRYTCNGNETVHMLRRLKEDGWFALAMGQWAGGDAVRAEITLTNGLEEMHYTRNETKGQ